MTFNLNRNYQIENHQKHKIKKHQKLIDIFVCLSIRLIFLIQVSFSIYFLVDYYVYYAHDYYDYVKFAYLCLALVAIIIIIDSYYVAKYRNGKEYTWYSISSIFYTIVIITLIWQLVYTKIDDYENKCEEIYDDLHDHLHHNKSNIAKNDNLMSKKFWLFVNLKYF